VDGREKIWIYDVDRGTRIPLMADESGPSLYHPVWSPDGKQLAYRDTEGKSSTLRVHAADGSGQEDHSVGECVGMWLRQPTGLRTAAFSRLT
jgi:Tol biopolymer transport system component